MTNTDVADREEGSELSPQYDANGLITAMIVDANDNAPFMLAHMNSQALEKTLETGLVHFYSRSRKSIWLKGETSGNTLQAQEIRVDCDQDALWIAVNISGHGAACHTGRTSCFYRRVVTENGSSKLEMTGDKPLFDPDSVYRK